MRKEGLNVNRQRTNVFLVGQRSKNQQRKNRYVDEKTIIGRKHPSKQIPELYSKLIEIYSNPLDIVLDPFNGIGTTTCEAIELDRKAIGIEISPEFDTIARENMRLAEKRLMARQELIPTWDLICGDAEWELEKLIEIGVEVDFIAFSDPWPKDAPQSAKYTDYDNDMGNMKGGEFSIKFEKISQLLYQVLKKGGYLSWSGLGCRVPGKGNMYPLISMYTEIMQGVAKFKFYQHIIALLGYMSMNDNQFKYNPRTTNPFEFHNQEEALRKGERYLMIQHEDVLIFKK
jgi:hypothetical protein